MAGGRFWTLVSVVGVGLTLAVFGASSPADSAPTMSDRQAFRHEGVASCGGSTSSDLLQDVSDQQRAGEPGNDRGDQQVQGQ